MGLWERVDRKFLSDHGFPQNEYYIRTLKDMNYRQAAQFTIEYLGISATEAELMQEWDRMAIDEYRHSVPLKEGAKELLLTFHEKKRPIILATVSSSYLYRAVLEATGIYGLFTGFVSDEVARIGKDKPDIYLNAASIAGVEPAHCMVFEDVLKGIRSAKEASFMTCAVEDASQERDRSALKEEADLYVQSLDEARGRLRPWY